jgi:ubiquinone/menaquinone biosynthesis C-methylase UbiE
MDPRNFYNETAGVYELRHETPTTRVLRRLEKRFIEKYAAGKVLDAGCGTGFWLGKSDVGFDLSETMLKKAKDRSNPVFQAAVESVPLRESSFDTVLCMFTVLNMCDFAEALPEFRRIIRPEGRLIASVASVWDHEHMSLLEKVRTDTEAIRNLKKKRFKVHGKRTKIYLFEKQELIDIFNKNGFRLLEFDSLYSAVKPKWNNYEDFNPIEKVLLRFERLLPLKEFGCVYLVAAEKM